MSKVYTIEFTADELAMIEPLVQHEANYYETGDDEIDRAQFAVCESIIEKITAAS
jgi:hypothetical protein